MIIMSNSIAKPFLKWAGGKGQLLKQFNDLYPSGLFDGKIKNYYEPFLGSGAVFFSLAAKREEYGIENFFLSDNNEELILTFNVVKQNPKQLMEKLSQLEQKYLPLDTNSRKEMYYKIREQFNLYKEKIDYSRYSATWHERAAQVIFLNRTCFNGLFRVNQCGEFNVPMGSYVNPRICDSVNLQNVSDILQDVTIKHVSFSDAVKWVKPDSFVYFDPPYRPLSRSSAFTAYHASAFADKQQVELSKVFAALDKKEVKAMLSNSDPKNQDTDDNFFDELYAGFNIKRITAKRMINSKGDKRGSINEIVVRNYSNFNSL